MRQKERDFSDTNAEIELCEVYILRRRQKMLFFLVYVLQGKTRGNLVFYILIVHPISLRRMTAIVGLIQ